MLSMRVVCLWGALGLAAALDPNQHPDLAERPTCSGQNIVQPKTRVTTTERLRDLRQLMATPVDDLYKPIDAYIVPMDDEHQTEYIAPQDQLVKFISGFSGSAATAVITAERAALWTDGRYFLQAEDQLDCNWFLMKEDAGAPEMSAWLAAQLGAGGRVGSDPHRMSARTWLNLKEQLSADSVELVSVDVNLIANLWKKGRPEPRNEPLTVHPLSYAGVSWQDKVAQVRAALKAASSRTKKVEALLVAQLDEIAWLLNVRGDDMPHTPEFKGYAVVDMDSVHLFVDDSKLTSEVRAHLRTDDCTESGDCVMIRPYEEVSSFVAETARVKWTGLVWVPSRWSYAGGASYALYKQVPDAQILFKPSPIIRMKAMKNPVEVASMKQAHLRDSTALCDFLAMLEQSVGQGKAWTELSVASKLIEYRQQQDLFRGTSFTSIVGFGPNGAIIHYKASPETDTTVDSSDVLLLDSGGQYPDGTTDVTRTMHYGQPTDFQREAYTRVLMGVIDLGRVVFKKGATDSRLDILARRHLYDVGLDYQHGTGHGIGIFLQVHEASTQLRIYQKEEHIMEEGMFFSNEPGYYEAGQFGVRLETIMFVKFAEGLAHNFSGPYLAFEPVTLVPFERKLIKEELLNEKQLDWLNAYHQRVRDEVGEMLRKQKRAAGYKWLMDKTEPIRRPQVKDCPTLGAAGRGLGDASTAAALLLATAAATVVWRLA
ncbi:xaa-Pro aminopeptidase 1-like [Pollicipes pollicipes]|uniref:xaa-Pro aminopeptidase 1-like n=1 Tax=Pollicipes pollicipes TaxID=41117 RepID=UPI001884CC07|nr:xaa-Pro aminopeptidase 1-like [Pollicipes pollicipes]XP_037087283.1 xaa-Pro aminopeptidase 1-like [Pollicipes pollicipes]